MPGLDEGALYKFEILSRVENHLGLKVDPYGFASELRPKNASVVCNIDRYEWKDSAWLEARTSRNWLHVADVDLRSSCRLLAAQYRTRETAG